MNSNPAITLNDEEWDQAYEPETVAYLEALTGSGDGLNARVHWQSFDDAFKTGDPRYRSYLARSVFGSYKDLKCQLRKANRHGAGIFVGVNETDGITRSKETIVRVRSVWADIDGTEIDISTLPLAPSIVVQSHHGPHLYWRLIGDVSKDECSATVKSIAHHLKSDPKVHNPDRVLRVPGFFHLKNPSAPFPVRLVKADRTLYRIEDIHSAFPPIAESENGDQKKKPKADGKPNDSQPDGDSRSENKVPLGDRIAQATVYVDHIPGSKEPGRHNEMFKVASILARGFELPDNAALPIFERFASRCEPPVPHCECQSFLEQARRYGTEPFGGRVRDPKAWSRSSSTQQSPSLSRVMEQLRHEGLLGKDKNGHFFVLKRPMAYRRIFELDDQYRGHLQRNEMGQRDFFNGREIRDETITEIENDLDLRYGLSGGVDLLNRQVNAVCADNAFHPVCDYLKSCPAWDGVDRIDRVLVGVLGAAPTDLNREMMHCFYRGSVARVMERGCKMDTALVLKSAFQGNRKTTFFDVHCEGISGAFLEGQEDFISKDGLLAMHGAWIVELGEIDSITRKKDAELVKNLLSRRADVIRVPYGRRNAEMRRSFTIVGTTNNSAFLSDTTGHRRFHVIETGDSPFDLKLLRDMVPQLWAQALHEYRAGNQWWLNAEMETVHELGMVDFEIDEPWNDLVTRALDVISTLREKERPIRTLKGGVAIAEILEQMGVSADRQTHASAMRVAEILRNREWTRPKNQVRVGDAKVRLWIPP